MGINSIDVAGGKNDNLKNNKSPEVLKQEKLREAQEITEKELNRQWASATVDTFMSDDTVHLPVSEELEYHFDTRSWGNNQAPQPYLVIRTVNCLIDPYKETINGFLTENPANILGLQKYLNGLLYYPGKFNRIIDVDGLNNKCIEKNMPLLDGDNDKFPYKILEDGKLGPQTFAAICYFNKPYKYTFTSSEN